MIHLHTLLVDDEPDIREVIDLSLALDPLFRVRECPSGRDAVRAAIEWRPDLILLDVMMPIMDGPTTLAELRADRRTATIPVVFMTARAQMHECEGFRSLGAAGVIAKPFDPIQLPTLVRECVANASAPAEDFLWRLDEAFATLTACQANPTSLHRRDTLIRIKDIAETVASMSQVHGFTGISLEAAALEDAVDCDLGGRSAPAQLEDSLNRVLSRIATH